MYILSCIIIFLKLYILKFILKNERYLKKVSIYKTMIKNISFKGEKNDN